MSDNKSRPYHLTITIPQRQVLQLNRLREALAAKMGKEMTLKDLVEKIIDDFLTS
jgi:hypothetical protein